VQSTGLVTPGWPAGGVSLGEDSYGFPGSLLADDAGGVFALWARLPSSTYDVYLHRVEASGVLDASWPAGGLQLGSSSLQGFDGRPLIRSGSDHVMAAWAGQSAGNVWLQRAHRSGVIAFGWPAGGLPIVQAGQAISGVKLVPDGAEGAYVAWHDGSAVRAVRVLPEGTLAPGWPAGGKSILDAAAMPDAGFQVASDGSGGLLVAWDDLRHPARRFVRVRWLLADGTSSPSEPDTGRVASAGALLANVRALMDDGASGAYVMWDDDQQNGPAVGKLAMVSRLASTQTVGVPPPSAAGRIRMTAPRPNPSSRGVTFTVSLADEGPAEASLLDLAGRRVRLTALQGPGDRTVRFDDFAGLGPDVYFVQVVQGSSAAHRKVVISR
jgi:hypothetical protein